MSLTLKNKIEKKHFQKSSALCTRIAQFPSFEFYAFPPTRPYRCRSTAVRVVFKTVPLLPHTSNEFPVDVKKNPLVVLTVK